MTADNHLGRHYDRMFSHRLEERRAWLRAGFARAVEYALEQRAHFFLQAGDLFDIPEPRNLERQFVAEALARLRDAGVRCLAIGGNHDYAASPQQPRHRYAPRPPTPASEGCDCWEIGLPTPQATGLGRRARSEAKPLTLTLSRGGEGTDPPYRLRSLRRRWVEGGHWWYDPRSDPARGVRSP